MAITSKGFAGGPMTDDDFGAIAARAAWVENAAALAVTQPSSGTRTVSIAAGNAVAHGVRAINDAAISQALTAPGSGGQWYLLVLRRDWTSGVKMTTLQVLTGASTGSTTAPTAIPAALPATFQSAAGSAQADQPLAWVWVSSASTTLTIFDTRIVDQRNRVMQAATRAALDTLALVYTVTSGALITCLADGIDYRFNGTSWKPWTSGWTTYALSGNWSGGSGSGGPFQYRFENGNLRVRLTYTMGASPTVPSDSFSLNLPVLPAGSVVDAAVATPIGQAVFLKAGSNTYQARCEMDTSQTRVLVYGLGTAGGRNGPTGVMTWAQNDQLLVDAILALA